MKNKIFLTLILLLITANAGLCEQTRSAIAHNIAIKFGLAMAGVIISSLIIYVGLTIYNKIRETKVCVTKKDEILKTPKTTEDAIRFFIRKNKL